MAILERHDWQIKFLTIRHSDSITGLNWTLWNKYLLDRWCDSKSDNHVSDQGSNVSGPLIC